MTPESSDLHAARAAIRALDAETVAEQSRIAAIPAPAHGEAQRAAYLERRFRESGLVRVERDAAGNVIGWLPGGSGAPVVVSAHLDTVFAADVPVEPRIEGSRVYAPGITDNARGLAALLALARVMAAHGRITRSPVVFAATVGEEGAGDLKGAKHLFRAGGPLAAAAASISLDGSGLRRVVNRGVGARRLRVSVVGPGGHSWSDWGAPNPIHAVGAAAAALAGAELPASPATTVTVARIGGGTSINALPEHAWMEIDIRSEERAALEVTEDRCRRMVERSVAAEREGARRGPARLALELEVIGDRPPGRTARADPLVQAALRVTRELGARPELAASSTDANVPMSLGIPAVTIGAGGRSGGVHTLHEWYENVGGALGIERALLLVVDRAEAAG